MVKQLRVLLSLVVCLLLSVSALAASRTWTGAVNANWSQPANWSPSGVPQPSDALTFQSGAANRDMTNDLPAGTSIGSMTFSGNPYTLSGNLLTLNGDVSGCTCNANLKLGAAVTFSNVRANGALDVNGQTLTASSMEINGALNGTGVVIVRGAFSGGLTVKGAGNFSGTIQDDAVGGTLQLDGSCSLPNATVALQQIMQFGSAATLGDVTITPSSSGAVTPGPGGILHTKSFAVQDGGFVAFVGVGASSQIDVKGTVTLTGARLLLGGGGLLPGQSVIIIQNDGTDPVAGTFSGLPEGAAVNGSQIAYVSYVGGDGNDVVLTSPAARIITNTVVTQSTSSTPFGAPVTLTATISTQSGTPAGSVTFMVDGVSAGSGGVQNGVATWNVTNLSVGDHTIAAAFHGAGAFIDSTSFSISHAVSHGQTKTEVVATQPGTIFGQPAHFTITVNALSPSLGQPAGSVSVLAGGMPQGTAPLINGIASFETSSLHAGAATITATYSGDTNFGPSTASAIQQNVGKAQTELDVRLLPTVVVGNRSVIGVSVSTVPGSALAPAGSVSISERGVVLAVQPLDTGKADIDLGRLPMGDHLFLVSYTGGNDFEPTSLGVAQSVLAPAVSIYGTRVAEGNAGIKTISLTVSLSAPVTETVRVSYATLDGSAHEPEDYEKTSGVVEFAPGEMSRSIELHIVADTFPEADESFAVVLSDAVNATIDNGAAFVEIVNDDQLPPRHRPVRH
jgi:cytoskeletal protein CcmA (bactofilin family)